MNKFQLVVTVAFGALTVLGVIIFSAYKGSSKNAVTVAVWGTLPQMAFQEALRSTPLSRNKQIKIEYVEKSVDAFDSDFIEALAAGSGPDVFLLPSEKILKNRNKIFAIPYDVLTARQFKDSFVEGAEIYMAPEGTLALPVWTDPLVMYWNRSIFNEARSTQPPRYWDEFYDLVNLLSKKDGALNISRSAAAMGEFSNISNAKKIILNLTMQAGNPVTFWEGQKAGVAFADSWGKPIVPAEAAVNFYTEFGNPAKPSYSWNRSLPNSTDYFLQGDLGIYFGMASEAASLQLKNPNLNFDVAPMPVSREGGADVSFADFYGFAITKSSKNPNAAFSVISALSGQEGSAAFAKQLHLPPARRDLLGRKPSDAYESVFYDSAIRAKSWLDPSPLQSDQIFKAMIESITSGRSRTNEAVGRADKEIESLMAK